MTVFIFSITMCVFAMFFWRIDVWRLALLPLLGIFLFIGSHITHNNRVRTTFSTKEFIQTNSLFLGRVSVLTGLGITLQFFDLSQNAIIVGTFFVNMLLWISAEVSQYKDGQRVFHMTHYFILIVLFVFVFLQTGFSGVLSVSMAMFPFHVGIYAFLVFIVGVFRPVRMQLSSILCICIHATVLITFIGNIESGYLFLIIMAQLYLSSIYYGSYKVHMYVESSRERQKRTIISAKEILAGKKVLDHKKFVQDINNQRWRQRGEGIWRMLHPFVHEITFLLNTIVVTVMIGIYIYQVYTVEPSIGQQLVYWISIGVFFYNFILIKKQSVAIFDVHKIFVFIIINFAIYTNIIYIFGIDNITTIAMIGIVRNYFNGFMILQSKSILPKGLFTYSDYRYWVATNIGALLVNIVLILYSSLPSQLKFGLITFYLGSYVFLTYYNIKYIQKLEPIELKHIHT